MQSVIIYTIGIRLFMHLSVVKHAQFEGSVIACLITTLAASAVGVELFYRVLDYPSMALAHKLFDWIRE